jgi:hypothetical protein
MDLESQAQTVVQPVEEQPYPGRKVKKGLFKAAKVTYNGMDFFFFFFFSFPEMENFHYFQIQN